MYMGCDPFTCTWDAALHMYMGCSPSYVHGMQPLHMYMGCSPFTCTWDAAPSHVHGIQPFTCTWDAALHMYMGCSPFTCTWEEITVEPLQYKAQGGGGGGGGDCADFNFQASHVNSTTYVAWLDLIWLAFMFKETWC